MKRFKKNRKDKKMKGNKNKIERKEEFDISGTYAGVGRGLGTPEGFPLGCPEGFPLGRPLGLVG